MASSFLWDMLGYMTVSAYTPGPGNILSMNTTTRYGWKKGRRLIFGICCGYLCDQFICTMALYGLSHILEPALDVLKYVGTGYMIWLAIHMMRSRPLEGGQEKPPTFRAGFFLQLVNVKIYFYMMTLLTAYLMPNIKSLPGLFAAGLGVVAFGSVSCLAWAAAGLRLHSAYLKHYKVVNIVLGLFLLYCAWNIITNPYNGIQL